MYDQNLKIGIEWKIELFDGNQSGKEENIN